MGLRKQLFLVSLTILLLPWAGCQYIQEMEQVLRGNQADAMAEKSQLLSKMLTPHLPNLSTPNPPFYTALRYQPVQVDGYDNDWQSHQTRQLGKHGTLQKNLLNGQLYIFLRVNSENIRYLDPSHPNSLGNHIRIISNSGSGQKGDNRLWLFTTSAPGPVQAKVRSLPHGKLRSDPRIDAWWSETRDGYNLEVGIPTELLFSHLDLEIYDHDNRLVATTRHSTQASVWLYPMDDLAPNLTEVLTSMRGLDRDAVVINPQGWPISAQRNWLHNIHDALEYTPSNPESLMEQGTARFYRIMVDTLTPSNSQRPWPLHTQELSRSQDRFKLEYVDRSMDETTVSWFQTGNSNQSALLAIQPLIHAGELKGYILLSQTADALVSLTNQALQRVSHLTIITVSLVLLVLVLYASLLSWRIRSLKRGLENSLRSDGRPQPYKASTQADEIGDLSRSYQQLLTQIQGYTHYLETLNGKLAHELRTPLTIAKSSLELMGREPENPVYLQRAEQGIERLRLILSAMSEASRVEQSIQLSDMAKMDLLGLLTQLQQAYDDTYHEHHFVLATNLKTAVIHGNPELLSQLLDKLVDNARSFAPPGSEIKMELAQLQDHFLVKVQNSGPPLPVELGPQLFDSLVSQRDALSDGAPQLGLGLFIVRLICQAHSGEVSAHNLPGQSGVEFMVKLPTYP